MGYWNKVFVYFLTHLHFFKKKSILNALGLGIIICEKTVDEKIVKALRNKINIASEVLGEDLKQWI